MLPNVPDLPDRLIELYLTLPGDRPFPTALARELGAGWADLRRLVAAGLLRHPVHGVYCSAALPDDLDHRIDVLCLVVPDDCVVTDRTAGWLWQAPMILAPGDHLETPKVSVFGPPGRRLRNELTASGERSLAPRDVMMLKGLRVTTPLRTACDLGRLLHRDQALAAMDALASLRVFTVDQLGLEVTRFKHYRGVVQLRALAPLVDPLAGSPGESVLRLRWYDAGLPRPECQVEIPAPDGGFYLLDIALRERRLAAEYDGEEFHGEEHQDHDEARREWAREHEHWTIVVARRHNLHGRDQDIERLLRQGNRDALLALATR
jgi:hypothetical protein